MVCASELISGLEDEKIRWTEQLEQFKTETDCLIGDVLILAGFLNYSGPFNQEFRSVLLKTWFSDLQKRSIPFTSHLNIIEQLADSVMVI